MADPFERTFWLIVLLAVAIGYLLIMIVVAAGVIHWIRSWS
jgi:hypothetical protein